MENTTSKPKKALRWRILRWGVIGLAGLVTLVGLLWAEENWRSKGAWRSYQLEREAKGEKFELKAVVPPPVADEENFAMTPFLAPLFDFRPNRKPNESAWRDTNAYQKTLDFGNDRGSLKSFASWDRGQKVDLTAWAVALDGKKEVPDSGESASERAASGTMVLAKMKKYGPVFEELRTASRRPYSRFNISYMDDNPHQILLPHLALLKKLTLMYQLRASAELAAGQGDAALEDIRMILYLSDSIKDEPFLLDGLVQIAMLKIGLQPVWEGLADHRWTETQLKKLQERLEKVDLLKGYETLMRGERAFNIAGLEYERRTGKFVAVTDNGATKEYNIGWTPSALFYRNQLALGRMYEKVVLPPVDSSKHRVYLELATNEKANLDKEFKGEIGIYTIFAKMLFPAIQNAVIKFANLQAYMDEAITACALERYRLAHGQFPETLETLSPQFMDKAVVDPITGDPLKYQRTEDGWFVLYSVGWNGTDDGGKVAWTKGSTPSVDPKQGDWVWRYAAK